jgi:hypothetical protein
MLFLIRLLHSLHALLALPAAAALHGDSQLYPLSCENTLSLTFDLNLADCAHVSARLSLLLWLQPAVCAVLWWPSVWLLGWAVGR